MTAANALEDVTETVTLNTPILQTWQTDSTYIDFAEPCDSVSKLPHQDPPDGQIIVGYIHDGHMYFKYLKTITCTEEKAAYFRGAVWFDLTPVTSKAPAPRVFVTKATLNFRKIDSVAKDNVGRVLRDCRDEVMIGTGNCSRVDMKRVILLAQTRSRWRVPQQLSPEVRWSPIVAWT